MESMFCNFVSKAKQLKDITDELKWYEKINIVNRIKISKIKNKLYEFIDSIDDMTLTVDLLKDFQRAVILNIDTFSCDSVNVNYDPKYEYIPIFYHMVFHYDYGNDDIDIDVVSDVIHIKSTVIGNINTKYYIPESNRDYIKLCTSIKWCIKDYLESWL